MFWGLELGSKLRKRFREIKAWVLQQVLWAENNLKGKSGREKKAAVVERLDDMISLPWYLEWLDGPLIGWLVDLVCDELNWLSDNDFTGLELTEQEAAAIVEGICYSVADVPYSEGVKESANERIEEIEARIGAARKLEDAPGAPDLAESENDHTPWQTPFWNEGSKPVLTPPLSEEERQKREANFQKAIEFVLKWIERRNFNVVNSEPVMKAAIGDDGHGPVTWGVSIPTLKAAYLAGVVGH